MDSRSSSAEGFSCQNTTVSGPAIFNHQGIEVMGCYSVCKVCITLDQIINILWQILILGKRDA